MRGSSELIPLEDELCDVVWKSMRGQSISKERLLSESGIKKPELAQLLKNESTPEVIQKVSKVLGLKSDALWDLSQRSEIPPVHKVTGLWQINTEIFGMRVNAYLVKDPTSKKAVLFDTGGDAEPIFDLCEVEGLDLETVYFTHNHRDHVAAKEAFIDQGVPLLTNGSEPIDGAKKFKVGDSFTCGALHIETRLTCGHSMGGVTFVIEGLEKPVAIVGDALFARSLGGGVISYENALRTNRKEIFSLRPETIICPGHGPLTTVADELEWNPFS